MSNNIFNMNSKLAISLFLTSLSAYSFAGIFEPSSTTLILGLFGGLLALVVFIVGLLGDRILKLVAANTKDAGDNVSLFNSFMEYFFGSEDLKKKNLNNFGGFYKLKEGLNINLKGKARRGLGFRSYTSDLYAIKPTDFVGLKPIPKMLVKEGETVKAGDPLFYDKGFEGVKFTSPVSGKILEIRRGAKRSIAEIVIDADAKVNYKQFDKLNPTSASREDVLSLLAESGALAWFTERPYGVVPSLTHNPDSIHVSCFSTAPLAPDYKEIFNKINVQNFLTGVDVLAKLTDNVHLNTSNTFHPEFFDKISNATINSFSGPHPAGNVGVQIHHISPIKKGDIVWTIKPEDVANIGNLFNNGIYEPKRFVALGGAPLVDKYYVETLQGVNVAGLVKGNLKDENSRVISGNPLSGTKIGKDGFLGFFDNQISVIEEGDQYELFGWILPSYPRPSLSPTFPMNNVEGYTFNVNTNTHGENRAFVVTGQYKQVLPMDIFPQFLIKAIIKEDFEEIEGLGIYELIEEDLALAEFVCTSKQPLQKILRDGLDFIRSQS